MSAQSDQEGQIVWSHKKTIWFLVMFLPALIFAVPLFSWSGLILFLTTCAFTLCVGHSVGLHRGLIHKSYKTHPWFRKILVTLGMSAGMGSLYGMLNMHETRDYWQNQPSGPEYFNYNHGLWTDFKWYVCMMYVPRSDEPVLSIEQAVVDDAYYQFLDRTWWLQQVLIGAVFYAIGGWSWVIWGVFVRVSVGIIGHWFVNFEAHTHGYQTYSINVAQEQGRNAMLFGAMSMGEAWHNNHHAWPSSARMGHKWWEIDIGYMVIWCMSKVGLVWDVQVAGHCNTNPNGIEVVQEQSS